MSQDPFFKLQGKCDNINSQANLSSVLRNGKAFHNGIYMPDIWEYTKDETPPLKGILFKNCSFSKTTLKKLYFVSCQFVDCLFINTHFDECQFHHCEFNCCNFFKSTLDKCYLNPNAIKGISKIKHPNIALGIFSELIKNAKQVESSNFQSDAEFYYRLYQRYQRRFSLKEKVDPKRTPLKWIWKLISFTVTFLADFVWMLISGYGLRSRYVVLSGFSFICILTYMNYKYSALIDGMTANTGAYAKSIDCLYFSVMTITTLGYGTVSPTNPEGKLWVALQAIAGVIWLTSCASVIVKKIVRSS